MWSGETKTAEWTRKTLFDVAGWIGRLLGLETSFHLSQFLSGYKCFRGYLHVRARASSPTCLWCSGKTDDAEHTCFAYGKFDGLEERDHAYPRQGPGPRRAHETNFAVTEDSPLSSILY